jgi:hypothetical protein
LEPLDGGTGHWASDPVGVRPDATVGRPLALRPPSAFSDPLGAMAGRSSIARASRTLRRKGSGCSNALIRANG